ncbi:MULTISPECIES: hypothetical protein [Pseudoalteromonas]|uniref:hypothetical protein n=1 Tax=Pseudoalteromonas TaxID=53246 RepID=UPI00078037F6|nr:MULTISPECIES: hypothetical protein [Gammaproteobacteria]MCF7517206.1 hypothetical protein [Pseudoalteromonas sp. L21]UJX24870.1 hypothetical protein L3Q70_12865 [Pseudoalteromonas sp. CF6-2]|tara:strand:+ start:6226 stop:6453 length:228 start_codon:yes stop_codon:yes gene_type:complete
MKQLIAAFSLMFLVISATVLASQMDVRFAKFDTNADGEISLTEATQHEDLLKQFADLDKNDDQVLSEQEFEKFKL